MNQSRDAVIGIDSAIATAVPHGASARYVWYVIVLLAVVHLFSYMDRMALAVLAPSIKADLNLSDAQLGLLIGFAFSLFFAICGLPIAGWADRGVRRNIIALALATWSVMTVLCGAAQTFMHLFLARIGLGVGEAGCAPPAQSILCDYVPLEHRHGVFAVISFGVIAGMMVGMMMAGWLGEAIGWRATFIVLGLPGVVLAGVVRFTLREPVRGFFEGARERPTALPVADTLVVLWRCRTYRLLTLLYALNGFVLYGMTQWWPSFYARSLGLSASSVGTHLGLAIGVGSGLGLLLGGALANKAARRDVRLPLIIGAVATALALPTALGTLFAPSARGSILMVGMTTLLWSVSSGPIVATAVSVVTARIRATAASINILFAAVLGFGLGPFSVGVLSDVLARPLGNESLRYALLGPLCLLPIMAIVLSVAARALPVDLRTPAGSSPGP